MLESQNHSFFRRVIQWIYCHWLFVSVLTILTLIGFAGWYFVFGPSRELEGTAYNSFNNAIWIEHAWVSDEKSISEIEKLVSTLGKYHIKHIFVHVGPIESNGKISPGRYLNAKRFLDIAHIYTDKLQFYAWMGQVRNKIDLKDPLIRKNIVDMGKKFTQEIGFNGIHYDIEPVWDGDSEFISLLQETKQALSRDKKLSVALAELIPEFYIKVLSPVIKLQKFNSEVFYKKVLDLSDGVAVMTYETGFKKDWIYRYFVKNEAIWATRLTTEKKIWIGVPTYEKGESFNPQVENMQTGLEGVIEGLNNMRSNPSSFLGIAIYPYWETQQSEWDIYEDLWIKK